MRGASTRITGSDRPPQLRIAQAAALVTVVLAASGLLGWATPLRRLASFSASYIPMAPSTGLAFLALGAAVLARVRRPSSSVRTAALALAVAAVGALQLATFFTGSRPWLEELLVPSPEDFGAVPLARMSPLTAAGFLLAALSLASTCLDGDRRSTGDAGGLLASLVLLLGAVVALGYAYATPLLYGGAVIPMALTTALTFGALGTALVSLAGRDRLPLRLLTGPSARARLLRALLPIAPAVVVVDTVFFRLVPVSNPALHAAVLTLLVAVVVTVGVSHAAHSVGGAMDRAERERRIRERAEAQLRDLDGRYQMLFENNPHPMWVYDAATLRFLAVNAAAVERYGHSRTEFLAMTLEDIRPAEDLPSLRDSVAAASRPGIYAAGTWRHRKKDGALIDVEISSHDVVFGDRPARLVLAADVSERRRLEGQLQQSQKLESIGQLAGGIAHDFNNLLSVITGYAELLRKDLDPGDRGLRRVDQIQKAAARAASLTHQLLAFSRKQVLQPKVLDLNAVLEDFEKMLRRLIGEHIQLVTVFGAARGRVRVDPSQMEQVILNLAVNARDAMPQGGRLILETANVSLDDGYCRSRPEVQPGRYVLMAVSDTGHGMAPDILARIFEPFFTTKEAGRGTGLGLSTVYGIVKQSGGHVAVYSEIGRGSTFKVYLPQTDEDAEAATPASADGPPRPGSGTILLLEDEKELRGIVREILEDAGYAVIEARGPEEAISIAQSHDGRIHLLLSDVVMPQMSGPEVAARLKQIRPDTPTLFMSGYTSEAMGHRGAFAAQDRFIEKPFTSDGLLRKVRGILEAGRNGP